MQEPHVFQTLRDAQHLAQGQAGTAGFQRIVYEIDEWTSTFNCLPHTRVTIFHVNENI